jgi:hypothetical protein
MLYAINKKVKDIRIYVLILNLKSSPFKGDFSLHIVIERLRKFSTSKWGMTIFIED